MITLHGIPASPGVAIGPAWLYQKVQLAAYEELSRLTAQAEQRRFDCAVQEARAQLDRLYEKTVREAGEAAAQIFDIHKMMMEDLDYLESVEDNITNQLYTAEHAVACAGQEFAEMFASMDDEVMRARSADIRDITQRLLQVLTGGQSQALEESSWCVPMTCSPATPCSWSGSMSWRSSRSWAPTFRTLPFWPAPWESPLWWASADWWRLSPPPPGPSWWTAPRDW